ncbi:uncharacterized protein V1516DRAFT_676636 [Lipomyces oligophaga]|uniref:uncharacterized protein n=1 Tax=Lipomyces oligophaga TaxID=45792 RepID=UPI0034CEF6F4
MTTEQQNLIENDVNAINNEEIADPVRALDYMKAFASAQATRTEIYHEFESALSDYTAGSISIQQIQQVIRIAQEGFQDVSSDILRQERLLLQIHRMELANLIRKVQDLEEQKLRATVTLLSFRVQALSQPDISFDYQMEELENRLKSLFDEINQVMEESRAEMMDL